MNFTKGAAASGDNTWSLNLSLVMKTVYACRSIDWYISVFPSLNRKIETTLKGEGIIERCALPAFRHAVDDAGMLVARKAEADEPFPIKLSHRFFQQFHPPPVILDQVVVRGEDIRDLLLSLRIRATNL